MNWRTIVKLVLAISAAVITYIVANRLIDRIITQAVDLASEAEEEEEPDHPLSNFQNDTATVAQESQGGNGESKQKVREKT